MPWKQPAVAAPPGLEIVDRAFVAQALQQMVYRVQRRKSGQHASAREQTLAFAHQGLQAGQRIVQLGLGSGKVFVVHGLLPESGVSRQSIFP